MFGTDNKTQMWTDAVQFATKPRILGDLDSSLC